MLSSQAEHERQVKCEMSKYFVVYVLTPAGKNAIGKRRVPKVGTESWALIACLYDVKLGDTEALIWVSA
jgi:hypothetical protein